MDVRKYRLTHGLTVRDVVKALKPAFPRYSKAVQCMVENPGSYGVRLVPEAERLLDKRRGDRHRMGYRLSCRVTKGRYDAVKQAIEADGRFPTVQAWLDWWVYVWVKRAAAGAGDTDDGKPQDTSPMASIEHEGADVNVPLV